MSSLKKNAGLILARGIITLLPLIAIFLVLRYVVNVLNPLAEYIAAHLLRVDPGIFNFSYTLAFGLALAITMLAGWLSATSLLKPAITWLEDHLLMYIPGYLLLRNSIEFTLEPDEAIHQQVFLAPVDGWQFAFVMEELPDDELALFVPGAPIPRSGSVMVFKRSDLRETSITAKEAYAILRRAGKGYTRI